MTHPSLRHLDRTPYDEATRERVWARVDRARLEASLPRRRPLTLRPLRLAFVACGAMALALLAWRAPTSRRSAPIALGRLAISSEHVGALAGSPTTLPVPVPASVPPTASTTEPPPQAPAAPVLDKMHVDERAARKVAGYVEAPESSIEELFGQADGARAAGRPAEAVTTFEQIARAHPTDPRAALAMLTAARIHLDTLHRPAEAVRCFERALALGLPPGLAEDARTRSLEARSLLAQ